LVCGLLRQTTGWIQTFGLFPTKMSGMPLSGFHATARTGDGGIRPCLSLYHQTQSQQPIVDQKCTTLELKVFSPNQTSFSRIKLSFDKLTKLGAQCFRAWQLPKI
jgi:hypothetical protein